MAGLERHDGLIPYFWDPKKGQLLLEIHRRAADVLYGCGLASGVGLIEVTLDRAQLGDVGLCRFERVGPRVLFRQLQTTHVARGDRDVQRVAEESFPTSTLASFAIVAEDADRALVDATEFLLRDPGIARQLKEGGQGEFRADLARSSIATLRSGAFPRNTELEADLTLTCDAPPAAIAALLPDGRTLTVRLHHTFLAVPGRGFEVRELDPRVGYFAQGYRDHAAPFDAPLERARAMRWRLPKGRLTYYLDRGIPEPERSTVRAAILWWNRAFAEAGRPDLLEVKDLPPGATFLDARYSGVAWVNRADRSWSFGEVQSDPRTGEILHAVARLDSHRRRTTARIGDNLRVPRGCAAGDGPDAELIENDAVRREMVLARLAYLAAHEVGHTLGLGHNWAATTYGWGSVMDYLPPALRARDGAIDASDAYPRDIGPYDRLAIRWGYGALEATARDRLLRDANAQGIVLPHTEDARWVEYDFGPDPVVWLRNTQAVRRILLDRFGYGQLEPGRPVHELTQRFSLAYLHHRFALVAVQRLIGGRTVANALAGDGQVPSAPIPVERQLEALEALITALESDQLEIQERIVDLLVPAPSGLTETRERFASAGGELFDANSAARSLASLVVEPLLEPRRAARLAAAPSGSLTFDRLVRRLLAFAFDTPPPSQSRERTALHRLVTRVIVTGLINLAAHADVTPEVQDTALTHLVALRKQMGDDPGLAVELARFLDHPDSFKARSAAPAAPPGRPIGGP